MNTVRITIACAAVLSGAANANLIVNGSFENSSLNPGGSWSVLGGGNTSIDGWVTVGGGIDYFGTIITASDGIHSIDLNNVTPGGGIMQTFDTNVGWIYTVEFDMSANMYGGPTPKVLRVHAGGDTADFEFDYVAAGATAIDPAWERMSWTFVATSSSTDLWFEGISTGVYGAALDTVVVTGVVPAPGALAGFGVLGVVATRRRRG
jgi:choice-of-anchor C domain-containing protein